LAAQRDEFVRTFRQLKQRKAHAQSIKAHVLGAAFV
jgi:hypothetical protein